MAQNPYAPPTAPVKDRGPERAIADKPKQVTYAVSLLSAREESGILRLRQLFEAPARLEFLCNEARQLIDTLEQQSGDEHNPDLQTSI